MSGSKDDGGAQSWVVHAAGVAVGAEAGRVRLSPLECATMLHTINPKVRRGWELAVSKRQTSARA